MKKFPKLNNEEVALLRVDTRTGIVLSDQFAPDIAHEQVRFTVFETLEEALSYIQSIRHERREVEFVIYNKDENIIEHIK